MQCDYCISIYRVFFFFFNDTATTEIYTLSLHDALPISPAARFLQKSAATYASISARGRPSPQVTSRLLRAARDRKSTRLNSSHANISYVVFCLKKIIRILYHANYIREYTCETMTPCLAH